VEGFGGDAETVEEVFGLIREQLTG
jgi:hypothetical protein